MAKVNLKISLKQSNISEITFNTVGYYNESKIIYYDKETNVKNIYDLIDDHLIRENDEMIINLTFLDENKSKMELKKSNSIISIPLKTLNIDKNENRIQINYKIEEDNFDYNIEYEVQK